jgi:hypothetical protein
MSSLPTHQASESGASSSCRHLCHRLFQVDSEGIKATLPAVDRLLSDPEKSADQVWADMLVYLHKDGDASPGRQRSPRSTQPST